MVFNFNSIIETHTFENFSFYLKRDDLLSDDFSGNKARKLHYFLQKNFPNISKLISYGSAQSNAMYSLSVLAQKRGWKFDYYVEHIASYLKENPHGNYKKALCNGMNMIEATPPNTFRQNELFIQEGGRQKEAEFGIKILAQEIKEWQKKHNIQKVDIFLPSGTGTTALFLQKHTLNRVYTTPCVGDKDYLKKQFFELEKEEKFHPTLLTLEKKHHFGKLYRQNYEIWLKLQQETKVEFDLLYDPLGWRVLLQHKEQFLNPILYIHQGGVLGNESMLLRYQRKYKDNV